MFPFINLFFMFFSIWVALSPRFQTEDQNRNWWTYRLNLVAALINAAAVLHWLFTWVSA